MPTPDLTQIGDNPTQKQIVDYVVKLQRDLNWLLLNLDDLNVRRIRAEAIFIGRLDANLVTIRSDLTSGHIQIDGNGMVVNNGLYDTVTVDINGNIEMTSKRIRSANGYLLIEMNYDDNLFGAYTTANDYIKIVPEFTDDQPAVIFGNGGLGIGVINAPYNFNISAFNGLNLHSGSGPVKITTDSIGGIQFKKWSEINSIADAQTLKEALQDRAKKGFQTDINGGHNHGIAPSVQLATTTDGVTVSGYVTWVTAADHSHTQ